MSKILIKIALGMVVIPVIILISTAVFTLIKEFRVSDIKEKLLFTVFIITPSIGIILLFIVLMFGAYVE